MSWHTTKRHIAFYLANLFFALVGTGRCGCKGECNLNSEPPFTSSKYNLLSYTHFIVCVSCFFNICNSQYFSFTCSLSLKCIRGMVFDGDWFTFVCLWWKTVSYSDIFFSLWPTPREYFKLLFLFFFFFQCHISELKRYKINPDVMLFKQTLSYKH